MSQKILRGGVLWYGVGGVVGFRALFGGVLGGSGGGSISNLPLRPGVGGTEVEKLRDFWTVRFCDEVAMGVEGKLFRLA